MKLTTHIDNDCITVLCSCGEKLKTEIEIDEAGDTDIIVEPCEECQNQYARALADDKVCEKYMYNYGC